jgi:virginiamycin B lyase
MPSRSVLAVTLVFGAILCTNMPAQAQRQTPSGGDMEAIRPGVSVSIKEWSLPMRGEHPHDPFASVDGSIWYTGQMASLLGRLDPKTGEFKEYRTKTPNSGPHGLVADKNGDIWFTANLQGYIGRLNPNTGGITEYRLPDRAARDPHTPVFDHAGVLWFTVQSANMVGKLVPCALWHSGEFRRHSFLCGIRHKQVGAHRS